MRLLLTIISVILYTVNGYCQHPSFKQITDEQGLPSNEVYDLFQDKKGFIWMGTNNGLCRYDGYNFKRYTYSAQAGRAATDIEEDNQGRIWCHNFAGQVFYIENEEMKLLPMPKNVASSYPSFHIDSLENVLYVNSNYSNLYTVNLSDLKPAIRNIGLAKAEKRVQDFGITWLYALGNNKISFAIDNFRLVIKDGQQFKEIKVSLSYYTRINDRYIFPTLIPFSIGKRDLFFDKLADRLFEATGDTLVVVKENFFKDYGLSQYATIQKNGPDKVWLCSFKGAICVNEKLEKVADLPFLFPDKIVSDVIRDNEGNYWVSTTKDGIFFIPSMDINWVKTDNSTLPINNVRVVRKYKDKYLLLGFIDGKGCIWDPVLNKVVKELILPVNYSLNGFLTLPKDDRIWMYSSVLYELDRNGKGKSPIRPAMRRGEFSKSKAFFAAGSDGLSVFEMPGVPVDISEWSIYDPVKVAGSPIKKSFYLRIGRSTDVCIDEEHHKVWCTFHDGLFSFSPAGRDSVLFNNRPIYGTTLDKYKETIICGTVSDGVIFIENGKVTYQLNPKNGLLSASIHKVKVEDNTLWILHEAGVDAYDLISHKIRHYTMNDGVLVKELTDLAVIGDKVYIASSKGLITLPVNLSDKNITPPNIYILSLKTGDQAYDISKSIFVPYRHKDISISFFGISYRSQQDFRYQYRLIGGDEDTTWITVGREVTELRFPALSPGLYRFEVKSINEDGVMSRKPAVVEFRIGKPFWQEWWFYLLMVLVATGLVSLYYIRKIRIQRKKANVALEKADIETKLRASQLASLKVQMNPHFIFNALNSVQDFMMTNEKRMANLYLGKFSDLMRMTLDLSQEDTVTLSDELKVLHIYLELEALRFDNELNWVINVDSHINPDHIRIPSMLVQPYIENAIKHGLLHKKTDKRLSIDLKLDEQQSILICTIEDNGVGRAKSEEMKKFRPQRHKSFGTSATRRRLELLNYNREKAIAVKFIDKINEKGEASGTTVIIEIPITQQ